MESEYRRKRRKKNCLKRELFWVFCPGVLLILILVLVFWKPETKVKAVNAGNQKEQKTAEEQQPTKEQKNTDQNSEDADKTKEEKKEEIISITISAAGDCTLGTDEGFNKSTSLPAKYNEVNNPAYFFEKVKPIFEKDDLTIVNMEGTLTEETTRADKRFAFKGDKEYTQILTEGSVETVNFANNHSKDYGGKSYDDTIEALDAANIPSFGYERTQLLDVKGIKVGLLGTYELADHMGCEEGMIDNINSLKEQGAQIIIASFHWGIERENYPNETQKKLAHSAIDHGVDLVLGHHPHVMQGIEEYNGKYIVYSLGNFCFGGNSGPKDMDCMIFQQTFTFKDKNLQEDYEVNVIPCKISTSWQKGRNDYRPMPAEGEVADKIMERIVEYSKPLNPLKEVEGEAIK